MFKQTLKAHVTVQLWPNPGLRRDLWWKMISSTDEPVNQQQESHLILVSVFIPVQPTETRNLS